MLDYTKYSKAELVSLCETYANKIAYLTSFNNGNVLNSENQKEYWKNKPKPSGDFRDDSNRESQQEYFGKD